MEPLTWTGPLGQFLNPALYVLSAVFLVAAVVQIVLGIATGGSRVVTNPDGTLSSAGGAYDLSSTATRWLGLGLLIVVLAYIVIGIFTGPQVAGIIGGMSQQLTPVWIALILTFAVSITFKRKLGLYGKLFDSTVGMVGFALVMFWVYAGVMAGLFDWITTHDSLSQVSGMKNKVPGTPMRGAEDGEYAWYLLGGDNLARDVFSRLFKGAWVVVQIAPLATVFAFMVGITLGLPAGFYGGRLDTLLSFLANLILAFPVILLFYLLVTPEIVATGIPNYMATVLFVFPLVFVGVLLNSRYYTQPSFRTPLLIVVLGIMGWMYLSLISDAGTKVAVLPEFLDLFDIDPGILVVFVSVVFVNAPTVFRIVRGLALDIKTRDYVAAAQTRGEGPWYIMLWEILPNARGPLIVDFCLRIGYTTILLGTLGFFGLGLQSESPDWGTTINAGRRLLSAYPHPAIAPALSLLTMVLGLNLLADGLREESLKD
ncbi:peptide ABC transporter permease [Tateyamaria omphalii]|uniref:ABC transporter permease n=1 Tax=Tateyamaria omphalii TaxID=299262 RepID=UPI00167844F3|nr:ABC transporter permease [Tateyamaria omphalii]GGX46454.1 peptide ABC transporter permease [Tateyamaria omphalii]